MTDYNEIYRKRLEKRLEKFTGQFMSDSKWTKLFKILSENQILIKRCLIKDVLEDKMWLLEIPNIHDFADVFNEKGFNDIVIGGPSTFKQIEWIEFPHQWTISRKMRTQVLEPLMYQQDLLLIKTQLDSLGQLKIEFTNEKLIILGYN
jgi:hypothetical protein